MDLPEGQTRMQRVLAGMIGGAVGTVLMTTAMKAMHRRLPRRDRYPLPPRRVTMELVEKSGLEPPRRERDRKTLTRATHYAFGTGMGAVYSMIVPRTRWAAIAAALPFGLAVWGGSYLGWLPATGLHPPATEESAPRNALMIAAHFVWAGTIGALVALSHQPSAVSHE
jgi:uncharacterized membrane protein YagU involved in acid resistance